MSFETEHIGDCTLYRGDCFEVMPTLGHVGAVVTDPPYGIGKRLVSGGTGRGWHNMCNSKADEWDIKPPQEAIDMMLEISINQMIWGGNFFKLPPCDKPLCWDKVRPNQKNLSQWEYCWTSLSGRGQMFKQCANGGFIKSEPNLHPTQKPLSLIKWCLGFLTDAKTILDPFMGSGTTGVACVQLNQKFIGIEREHKYFDIACERIRQADGDAGPLFTSHQGRINFDARQSQERTATSA